MYFSQVKFLKHAYVCHTIIMYHEETVIISFIIQMLIDKTQNLRDFGVKLTTKRVRKEGVCKWSLQKSTTCFFNQNFPVQIND